jgi:hypothetical protein
VYPRSLDGGAEPRFAGWVHGLSCASQH